jgi:excisionase family DNA binding protein
MNRFLTTEEVAELCRTSPATVRYWRHVGKGPASFRLGRRVLYKNEIVEAFLTEASEPQRLSA